MGSTPYPTDIPPTPYPTEATCEVKEVREKQAKNLSSLFFMNMDSMWFIVKFVNLYIFNFYYWRKVYLYFVLQIDFYNSCIFICKHTCYSFLKINYNYV